MKRPRLLKVIVQPVFVIDDGETIEEYPHQQVVVSAAAWPQYSSVQFPAEVAAWEKQLNESSES